MVALALQNKTSIDPACVRRIHIFSELGSVLDQELLCSFFDVEYYVSGDTVFRQGDKGERLYSLISGSVAIFKKTPGGDVFKVAKIETTNDSALPTFGEGAVIGESGRSADLVAETDCVFYTISMKSFDQFCDQYPELALPVYRNIAAAVFGRLNKMNEDFQAVYHALISEIRGEI